MNAKASILIVDDENVVRDSLGKWFEEEGYRVETATTAHEALLKLPAQRWDVALVDINLSGKSGITLVAELKAKLPKLQVMMITAGLI